MINVKFNNEFAVQVSDTTMPDRDSFVGKKLVHLQCRKPVCLPVIHKQLIYFECPVFKQGRLMKVLTYLVFVFGSDHDPATIAFHTDCIRVYDTFINKIIDVSSMGRYQRHKLFIHKKIYGDNEFFKVAILHLIVNYIVQSTI